MPATADFSTTLIHWHKQHGRTDLPWQKHRSPYRVWISEIMLQQTQVATVIPYFERFISCFPDVRSLAHAQLDHVMHLWSGLGYYSRAQNLHRAARMIDREFGGNFPSTFDAILSLPGIGRSTAGAILALSLNRQHAILDGNVKRVLARYHAINRWPGEKETEKLLWTLAEMHTPGEHVDRYTQAIMDLGATVCRRAAARCQVCPLSARCQAHLLGQELAFPVPRPKRSLATRKTTMLLLHNRQHHVLLVRRPPTGIWANLWSLPEFDSISAAGDWANTILNGSIKLIGQWPLMRHSFTHFRLEIQPVVACTGCTTLDGVMEETQAVWYNTRQPDRRGLAAPVTRLLKSWHESLK